MRKLCLFVVLVILIPLPVYANPAGETRLQFPVGATNIFMPNRTLGGYGSETFVLNVGEGQLMNVQTLPAANLTMTISGASDGKILISGAVGSWSGVMPLTQDYVIRVLNGSSGSVTYGLKVIVPARIGFTIGTTYANQVGQLWGGQSFEYVIRASAGQVPQIYFSPNPYPTVLMTIMGQDGTIYPSVGVDYGTGIAYWSNVLPKTQDYVIQLTNTGTERIDYLLQLQIPAQIRFARGATSTTITGYVEPDQRNEYRLYALAGQTMTVTITSPGDIVGLGIYGPAEPLKRYQVLPNSWSGVLPTSQTYQIVATSLGYQQATNYTMVITITN